MLSGSVLGLVSSGPGLTRLPSVERAVAMAALPALGESLVKPFLHGVTAGEAKLLFCLMREKVAC